MNTQLDFRNYIIVMGVELAAPQYGTDIATLKGWMRGDNDLPLAVLQEWQRNPRRPYSPEQAKLAREGKLPEAVASMQQSSLAQRVLNQPEVQARIKAETGVQVGAPAQGKPLVEVLVPDFKADGDDDLVFEPAKAQVAPELAMVIDEANGRYSIYPARKNYPVTVCLPTNRDIPPAVYFSHMALFRKYEVGLELQTDTLLVRARNMIADRFLESRAQWSFWLDSDVLVPIGNADWFLKKTKGRRLTRAQAGFDVLERLLSHNAALVGAVYAARSDETQMVIQPDIEPRGPADMALAERIRKGQQHGLCQVGWLGFGCTLVHRRVFEAIRVAGTGSGHGEVGFFDTEGGKGEDVRFCERAEAAGFRPQLDAELVVGHLGRRCYLPEDTVPRSS